MGAYNPPLSETDARTGPPPYENSAKSTLLVIAFIGLDADTVRMEAQK